MGVEDGEGRGCPMARPPRLQHRERRARQEGRKRERDREVGKGLGGGGWGGERERGRENVWRKGERKEGMKGGRWEERENSRKYDLCVWA